ncbi:MAG: hypothetical protein C0434_01990 [Xanthomonadaceae bacterium]|nr:hypothetical protein [Xanthomonadaceae bacterium]
MTRAPIVAAALLSVLHLPAALAGREPFIPDSNDTVLERAAPRAADAAALRALNAERRRLARHPDDLPQALAYARKAIEQGRAEADPRYHGRAESALAPWLALADPPPAVRLLRATLRQQRHDFTGALADLDALIARHPDDQQARLTRATVLMVQGRPDAALADCDALLATRSLLLAAAVCVTSVRSLDGHAAAAAQALAAAIDESAAAPASERIWALTALAEMQARRGERRRAEAAFGDALAALDASSGHDPYLLTAWADFLLANGRAGEALAITRDQTRIDNLLLRHALAQSALGDPALADSIAQLDARFAEAGLRGESAVHLREEALYRLRLTREPARALELATRNWQSQREPADARLLLEAAAAARQPVAARPALDWIASTGIEDVDLRALAAALPAVAP